MMVRIASMLAALLLAGSAWGQLLTEKKFFTAHWLNVLEATDSPQPQR
jgi:hypothetical protein